jgi:hypothetical protein
MLKLSARAEVVVAVAATAIRPAAAKLTRFLRAVTENLPWTNF